MAKPLVKCSVSNCTYWGENNNCRAEAIMIDIDRHANASYGEEFAEESFESHQDKAATSSATCCHTFKPKHNQ